MKSVKGPLEEMKLRVKRRRDNGGRKRREAKGRKRGEMKEGGADEEVLFRLAVLTKI